MGFAREHFWREVSWRAADCVPLGSISRCMHCPAKVRNDNSIILSIQQVLRLRGGVYSEGSTGGAVTEAHLHVSMKNTPVVHILQS